MKKCPKCGKTYEQGNTLCPADGTALVKAGDDLLGKTLADKYRIEERISEGGMGTVYRATHVLMEKTVAVKVLHPSLAADDKIVARFTREAKAASRISHPHALNVTDFGEAEDGVVFLVMEYLAGRTLKRVVREEGAMPLARAVLIARQIAGALDAAHAEGVVHRDLKSDNIMLGETAGGDWAKVLDFGIAKIIEPDGHDPELTAPNLIIGTPQYMSPEQCSQASEIDARSDIYSFGVILYEMLTGHVPFTGESATSIMLKHLQESAPSVLEERKDLPPAVGQVIARALSKRPEDRQQSAGELAEALDLAAQDKSPAVAASTGENRGFDQRDTNRIVVPTASHESRSTANDDYDEATVVRANAGGRTPTGEQVVFSEVVEPPPAARFNPWVVIVPALALVVAVFGIFYVTSRNGAGAPANGDNSNAAFAVDPNAVPVQTASPATGAGESNITSVQAATPPPTPVGGAAAPGADLAIPNANANVQGTPALVEERTDNRNANDKKGQEGEDDPPPPSPSPSSGGATPKPTATPAPKPTVRDPADDPPPPSPRKTATPPPPKPEATQAPVGDPPPPSV
ncbi:MAG TPA: protein kinase [Pyrinomonadaceae bacterium]|jgi:serine/threonine-protein kinase|nr:protein kinase [Pyrinomonadaceae bacterium]